MERQVSVGGVQRSYIVYMPERTDAARVWPVIVAFHPAAGTAETMKKATALHKEKWGENFIVVYPQGYRRSWNDGVCCGPAARNNLDDAGFFKAILSDIRSLARVEERAYLVGWSNGARMVYRLLCSASDHVAAAAAFGATFLLDDKSCPMSVPVPLIHLHGEEDPASPITGGAGRGLHGLLQSRVGVPPAPRQSADFVARHNLCKAKSDLAFRFDKAVIECEAFTACQASATVAYCAIPRLGHNWPGASGDPVFGPARTDISGSRAILDFFMMLRGNP